MNNFKDFTFTVFLICLLCVYLQQAGASVVRPQMDLTPNCRCHDLNLLKARRFESATSPCNYTQNLVCCFIPVRKLSVHGSFCCFDHVFLTTPTFIKHCDPRLRQLINPNGPLQNYTKNKFNATYHHVSASIERSLLPNAIMVVFSLFFVFVYCFASLRRDVFRNRIYIERRDCCRLGPHLQMPGAATVPQPPPYNSLPKDPPRYSSIFGINNLPPSPTHSTTNDLLPPNNDTLPLTSPPPPPPQSLLSSPPPPLQQSLHPQTTDEALYNSPLQVLFLRAQTSQNNRPTRLAEVFKNILTSKLSNHHRPERFSNSIPLHSLFQNSSPTVSQLFTEHPSYTNIPHALVHKPHLSISHPFSTHFPISPTHQPPLFLPQTSNLQTTSQSHESTADVAFERNTHNTITTTTSNPTYSTINTSTAVTGVNNSPVDTGVNNSVAVTGVNNSAVVTKVTSSAVVTGVTSSAAVTGVSSSAAVTRVTSSAAVTGVTSSAAVTGVTSSSAVTGVTSSAVVCSDVFDSASVITDSNPVVASLDTNSDVATVTVDVGNLESTLPPPVTHVLFPHLTFDSQTNV